MAATLSPSYASGTSTVPMLGETIGDNLVRTAETHPERDVLIDRPSGRRWTYREFVRDVDSLARALMAAGLVKGDRVGIWAPNCPEWMLLQYATARIGVILVCVNPAYRSHELEYVVKQSGMRMLVAAVRHKTSDYAAMVQEVAPKCPELEQVIHIGDDSYTQLLAGAEAW